MIFLRIRTPPISAPVRKAQFEPEIRVKAGRRMKQARMVLDTLSLGLLSRPKPDARYRRKAHMAMPPINSGRRPVMSNSTMPMAHPTRPTHCPTMVYVKEAAPKPCCT